ncbi:DNA polymerase III subunit epsilon [Magnetofaba australis]|uniref:DNA polymerase III subunit epsilon n=1 Tax=Magnetofaba australis IT-1 TaxID=1434232 RepID=A0A1Y2JZU9_9PROT|nr:DNA polymerase III subunit epsilon [Magnetofaba australis]OSM00445.1 putative DNA polymerase III subunit epsilon [Magnetofaba australis IT-1]
MAESEEKQPQRLIVLDTETTGFDPREGHRIVEIGCVELVNLRKGEERQWYINPDRAIPEESTKVHGITDEMVAGCPKFAEIARDFLKFIGDDQLVIHNAAFDMNFLNAELGKLKPKKKPLPMDRAIDTIPLARRKVGGAGSVSLDALCKRFGVDNSAREFHGALLDAHLLAEVYIELTGGNQFALDLAASDAARAQAAESAQASAIAPASGQTARPARQWALSAETVAAHDAYLDFLDGEAGHAIWRAPDA